MRHFVEDLELLGKRDPAVARGETENRNGRVEVDAGGERKTERPAERREDVHATEPAADARRDACPQSTGSKNSTSDRLRS